MFSKCETVDVSGDASELRARVEAALEKLFADRQLPGIDPKPVDIAALMAEHEHQLRPIVLVLSDVPPRAVLDAVRAAQPRLDPVRFESSRGFARAELRRIEGIIEESESLLMVVWHEYFGN